MEERQNGTGPVEFTIVDKMEELPKETIPIKYKIEAAILAIYVIIFICILLKDKIPEAEFPLFAKCIKGALVSMGFISSLIFVSSLFVFIREAKRGIKIMLQGLFGLLASGLLYALYFAPNCCAFLWK